MNIPTDRTLTDGRISRSGRYAHFCYEWDDMLIDENDSEFATCLCFKGDPTAKVLRAEWWRVEEKEQRRKENRVLLLELVFLIVMLGLLYWTVTKVD